MTFRYATLALAAVLVVASCSTPSKPKHQEQIGTEFGQSKNVTYQTPVVPFEKPMFLAVGQHVRYGIVDKNGAKSVAAYSVIGHDGDIWTLESYALTGGKETWTQMKVAGLDPAMVSRNVEDVHVISARTKNNNDAPTQLDGAILSLSKDNYKEALVFWTMKIQPVGEGDAITVQAGTFLGTVKANTNLYTFGTWSPALAYFHPDVPISGLIKSASDNGIKVELLDFGTSGAKASF